MQSDVLLRNGHICKMIFGRSASVISVNNATHCKIHYHSNRGDCLVCLFVCLFVYSLRQNGRTRQTLLSMEFAWMSTVGRTAFTKLLATQCTVSYSPLTAPNVLLLDTARHVTPCKLASSYRHFGLSVTTVQSARRHISGLESSSRPLWAS